MAAKASSTKRAPTAAEAELAQRKTRAQGDESALREQAKEQRAEQRTELRAGKAGPTGPRLKSPAEQRTGRKGATPLNALVDNMTQRDASDALEGHFVTIDYGVSGVAKQVKAQLGDHVDPGPGSADYGVYLEPGETDDDGYPLLARVFLRDEHAAIINVPYKALRRATAGGRR